MRTLFVILVCTFAACSANAAEDRRSLAFSIGGFSGRDTSGVAMGFYALRPNSLGWYINGTLSARVDEDEDDTFRPIPSDVRVGSDTESVTLNVGLTFALGALVPYAGVGISSVSEYGLYRTLSDAFWYEEEEATEANFNVGILVSLTDRLGLDLSANSANEEIVLGLNWSFSFASAN